MKRQTCAVAVLVAILVATNSGFLLAVCCDDRVPWNSECWDSSSAGTCEDIPAASCPAMPSCESETRRYYLYEPAHECKSGITIHTRCVVGEEQELCYLELPCYLSMTSLGDVCVHEFTICDEEHVFVAEALLCDVCPGS